MLDKISWCALNYKDLKWQSGNYRQSWQKRREKSYTKKRPKLNDTFKNYGTGYWNNHILKHAQVCYNILEIENMFSIHVCVFIILDDQFLISFLRGTKYNQDLARQKIDLFFTMRSVLPEITQMRDIRTLKLAKLLKLG